MLYRHMTWEECEARYPRLVCALKWAACLSTPEAACAIRDYRDGRHAVAYGLSPYNTESDWNRMAWRVFGNDLLKHGGGEAVQHFGGPARAIARAIAARPARRNRWWNK